MVKLTVDLIARGTSGFTKKKRDESMTHYLKRLTHLYLEDRGIDEIGDDLHLCKNVIVLYLYDNKLAQVPNLNHNANLTHLYLQNNKISKLENLAGLKRLTKLYIGGNSITVVEGLEKLDMLQELHVENQQLPPGEKLLFDPRSLATLATCLQVLNVSGNHLDSMKELVPLRYLTQFMASDNFLTDMKELAHCLNSWQHLWRLELLGNPLCHKAKYRDRIIVMAHGLEVLDGKEINQTSRQFLENWQASKEAIKRRKEFILSRKSTEADIPFGENGDKDLPPVLAHSRHGQIPGYIMPGIPKKQFQDVLQRSMSLPHSAIPAVNRGVGKTYTDLGGPKYLNTYGTIYQDRTASGTVTRKQPTLINLEGGFGAGDQPVPQ